MPSIFHSHSKSMNNNFFTFPTASLFLLCFTAYPLGFGKVLFGSVPYFGDVPLVDLNVLPFSSSPAQPFSDTLRSTRRFPQG